MPPEARSLRMRMLSTAFPCQQGKLKSPNLELESARPHRRLGTTTRAYPPSRVTTPTLTTMLGLPHKAPTGPLVRQKDADVVSSTGRHCDSASLAYLLPARPTGGGFCRCHCQRRDLWAPGRRAFAACLSGGRRQAPWRWHCGLCWSLLTSVIGTEGGNECSPG